MFMRISATAREVVTSISNRSIPCLLRQRAKGSHNLQLQPWEVLPCGTLCCQCDILFPEAAPDSILAWLNGGPFQEPLDYPAYTPTLGSTEATGEKVSIPADGDTADTVEVDVQAQHSHNSKSVSRGLAFQTIVLSSRLLSAVGCQLVVG